MKKLLPVLVVFCIFALFGGTLYYSHGFVTTYVLCCGRNVEFVFRVTDAASKEPIPGAIISVRSEEFKDGRPVPEFKLVTDAEGRARILREDQMVEDVIRPFRKTVSLIPTAWCGFSIEAKGYRPVKDQWLAKLRYEDQGYSQEDGFQRVEFSIRMEKQ
jgi:hypothetical protein